MKSARLHAKGFTLIASLLLLLLLSGISIGLMMMVNTEGQVGGGDLQNNASFRATEGGVEKMTSDLAAVFQNAQSPSAQDICNVGAPANTGPAMAGITWQDYQVTPGVLGAACPSQANFKSMLSWGNVASGPNYGLYAQIVPVNMLATAQFPGGQEVSLIRNAQVALIPVFQFGVFSESDLSFFPGAAMDFAGPVHTNGDLYLAGQATVTFHSQLSAWGNVVRTDLANGNGTAANGYTSTIYIPTANDPLACTPTTNKCKAMDAPSAGSYGDGSVQGMGGNPPVSAYNGANAWNNFSKNTTSHEIINGDYGLAANPGTGATQLSMPFVNGTNHPYEIIRRPVAGEDPTSALGDSREYNMAQIHVLLSDDPNDFPGGAQSTDVRLANITTTEATATGATHTNDYGITMTAGNYASTFAAGTYQLYFAAASNAVPSAGVVSGSSTAGSNGTDIPDWPVAPTAWYGNAKNTSPTLQGLQPTGPAGGPGAPIVTGSSASVAPPLTLCPPAGSLQYTKPTNCPSTPASPYYLVNNTAAVNNSTAVNLQTATWNLIDGYLRVEYKDASGNWHPATTEWLNLGFARGLVPPTANGAGTPAGGTKNPINPNAILLLQEPADRGTDTSGAFPTFAQLSTGLAPSCTATSSGKCTAWTATPPLLVDTGATYWEFGTSTTAQSVTAFNWYPINFYDDREGENRDLGAAGDSCTTNGVMNAVEIDVGNLKRWLSGAIVGHGGSVDYQQQNGYVLYFSDRRGMLLNPHPPYSPTAGPAAKTGDSGLEDVINHNSSVGTPDGALEAPAANSPEDDNQNGFLDNFGPLNMGLGFYNGATNLNSAINSPAHPDPFGTATGSARITSCMATARKNWVSGARHVLRLVDGSLGNVPLRTDAAATAASPGGFTVASENPLYILGDYNSNAADSASWSTDTTAALQLADDEAGHAAAAVIADTVTLLSNNWTDLESMTAPVTSLGNRTAGTTTSYRLAIAAGKNRTFLYSTTTLWNATAADTGTDGGVHNFLRYLENWNTTAHYKGSLVSLYYSTYNTGFYKCCTTVYSPPTRDYSFDLDFTSPGGLPPGTPLFRDVESLGFRQLFTTRTN